MILQAALVLLLSATFIQSETTQQHLLFNRHLPIAIPHHFVYIRVPFPLQPFLTKIDQAISEMEIQKRTPNNHGQNDPLLEITDRLYENGIKQLKIIKSDALRTIRKLPTITRNRRQIDILATGIGAAALGMAFYNAHSISKLNDQIQELNGKHNQLVDITNLHAQHLAHLDVAYTQISAFWSSYFSHNPALIQMHIENVLQEFRSKVRIMEDLLDHGLESRMPVNILPEETMGNITQHLLAHAQRLNINSAVKNPLDVLHVQASYVFEPVNATITIILHCPFFDKLFQTYEYQQVPILSEKTKTFLLPKLNDRTILAIRASDYYFTTTKEEMAQCQMVGMVHICKERDLYHLNLDETCLGSIYNGRTEQIVQTCEFSQEKFQEFVAYIGKNQYLIFSPINFYATQDCAPQGTSNIAITNKMKLEVAANCEVKLKTHRIRGLISPLQITEGPMYLEEEINLDELNITESIHGILNETAQTLNITVQELRRLETNITDFSTLKVEEPNPLGGPTMTMSVLGGFLGIVVLVLICQIVSCYRCYKQRPIRNGPPILAPGPIIYTKKPQAAVRPDQAGPEPAPAPDANGNTPQFIYVSPAAAAGLYPDIHAI